MFKKKKRQATEWGRVFATTKKQFTCRIYKKLQWSIRWDLNKDFTKEDIQMANKNMKSYSATLVILKMQIKTTMGDSAYLPKWLKLNMNNTKCWPECIATEMPIY